MVLFPEKIGGLYVRLDRPWEGGTSGNLWISYSPDLVYWGRSECIMSSRGFAWDQGKIGPGAPPIKTKAGWLVIYHGITPRVNAKIYKAGVALLDLDDPRKVIARAKEYLMAPRELYERVQLTEEMFRFRPFTRLKQLKYLQATNQIDGDFYWR